jgi:hypothetical protein
MRTVPIRAAEPIEPSIVERVTLAFATCCTLADLMRWCEKQSPRVQISEIVTQDEYTHDVVLPFGAAFVDFDTT